MSLNTGLRTYDGAVAIITGAASGIGKAIAKALAAKGASVILIDVNIKGLKSAVSSIKSEEGKAEFVMLDVRKPASVKKAVHAVFKKYGRIDYMFNNAGIGVGGEFEEQSIAEWKTIIDINLMGVVYGIQAAYPIMIKQGFGYIVNTASVAGLIPEPGTAAYTATKHAVVGLTKTLIVEGEPKNVRFSALCPGFVNTPILFEQNKFTEPRKNVINITEKQKEDLKKTVKPMDPDLFAEKALVAIAKNKKIIIIPLYFRLMIFIFSRLFFSIGLLLIKRWYKKMLAALG
jgi:NAD(P)-dependent dehydrogenase (short-subunit alcohol dehydrogenase family)